MNKILGSLLLLGLTTAPAMAKDILDKLTVAPGFEVSLFADDV
ncbi:MAG TPA: sorbosone dehydrogenase, partial [Pseudoalteromonas sp.]|nr:sorbosone dehydrogenase [Pseudoalteromonas sp.]